MQPLKMQRLQVVGVVILVIEVIILNTAIRRVTSRPGRMDAQATAKQAQAAAAPSGGTPAAAPALVAVRTAETASGQPEDASRWLAHWYCHGLPPPIVSPPLGLDGWQRKLRCGSLWPRLGN